MDSKFTLDELKIKEELSKFLSESSIEELQKEINDKIEQSVKEETEKLKKGFDDKLELAKSELDKQKEEVDKKFDDELQKQLQEKTQIAVDIAEQNFDNEACERITKLLERVDKVHGQMIDKLMNQSKAYYESKINSLRKHYINKLKNLHEASVKKIHETSVQGRNEIKKLRTQLNENIEQSKRIEIARRKTRRLKERIESRKNAAREKVLIECIGKYLEAAVKEAVDVNLMREYVKSKASNQILKSLKRVLNVNESSAKKEFMPIVKEAKTQLKYQKEVNKNLIEKYNNKISSLKERYEASLQEKNKQINELKTESKVLHKNNNSLIRERYIDKKCASLDVNTKSYIKNYFKNSSKKDIDQNFDRVVKECKDFQNENNKKLLRTILKEKSKTEKLANMREHLSKVNNNNKYCSPEDKEIAKLQESIINGVSDDI